MTIGLLIIAGLLGGTLLVALFLRRVVPTNEVHIVQSRKHTKSFGKSTPNGNVYYEWPSFLPVIGITKAVFPVSIFSVELKAYEAYDKDRVPFVADIVAFFRIDDSNIAAERAEGIHVLNDQLTKIVQGAVRSVLAKSDINEIMVNRGTLGAEFAQEISGQLPAWGVSSVKNIELMDIRDSAGNMVIQNIMEKKKSRIEAESRTEVAENMKNAQVAEIEADREQQIKLAAAKQDVGVRDAEREKVVGIAKEEAAQQVKKQQALTMADEMAVKKVQEVTTAEIIARKEIVAAEAEKVKTELAADAALVAKQREAEGIKVEGEAKASAEAAILVAPVDAQIKLAKEIGQNAGYQSYLINIKQVEAHQVIGVEQAKALTAADVKVISNAGTPTDGINKVGQLFSAQGGLNIGAMLEGLATTEQGQALLSKGQALLAKKRSNETDET